MFRRTERSSDVRPHHDTIARLPAPLVPPEDETDNKSEPQIPESGQSVVGLPGTGKTHVATALGIQAIEHHRRKVRFFSTIELVNALEQEKAKGKAGQIAEGLTRLDLVILDDLGYGMVRDADDGRDRPQPPIMRICRNPGPCAPRT